MNSIVKNGFGNSSVYMEKSKNKVNSSNITLRFESINNLRKLIDAVNMGNKNNFS